MAQRGFHQQMIPVYEDFNDMGVGLKNVFTGKQFRVIAETAVIGYRVADRQAVLVTHVKIVHTVSR